jgi:hypothetical protein
LEVKRYLLDTNMMGHFLNHRYGVDEIAAIALSLGRCTVVTIDTDFAAVPGLSVENWLV